MYLSEKLLLAMGVISKLCATKAHSSDLASFHHDGKDLIKTYNFDRFIYLIKVCASWHGSSGGIDWRPTNSKTILLKKIKLKHNAGVYILASQKNCPLPHCRNSSLFFGTFITGFFKFFRFFSPPSNSSPFLNFDKIPLPQGGKWPEYISLLSRPDYDQ